LDTLLGGRRPRPRGEKPAGTPRRGRTRSPVRGPRRQLLRAWNDYCGLYDEISYWSPTEIQGLEVDFLPRRGKRFVAIEAKAGTRFRAEDAKGLDAIADLHGVSRGGHGGFGLG
jgi:hypothetical protein